MKKVLIIAYYWPPSGGGGVQRWLKFVKYLPQFGWKPIVVVPENPEYPVIDNSLEKDIPPEAEIIKLPIWEPYGIFKKITGRKKEERVNTGLLFDEKKQSITEKISLWIRGNVLIPDPRVFWVRPTIKKLTKQIPEIRPDVIITTGTPHSLHLIGYGLKQRFPDIPWLADLRDPWSKLDMLDQFKAGKLAKKRQEKLEHKCLSAASAVTTVSPTWAKELQHFITTPVKCITNGFDATDFNEVPLNKRHNKFIVSHVGIINSFRNPESLWMAFEELCSTFPGFKEQLEIQIIGITDAGLGKSLDKYPQVKNRTFIKGYIPHKEVIKQYSKSSCLLLLLNNSENSDGHIPGKFFEYVASGKPILAIAPKSSDVATIIKSNHFGFTCEFENPREIKNAIQSIYSRQNWDSDKKNTESFSRKSLTNKLTDILSEIIND